MVIHRARRQEETLTDLPIRQPLRQQLQHLHLPVRETGRIRARTAARSTRETTDAAALQLASHHRGRRRRTQSVEDLKSSPLRFLIALAEGERLLVGTARSFPCEGTLGLYADDVTYFDPITEKRLDGLTSVADYFRALFAGKVDIPRYEILNPHVMTDGNLAVLSYNLANYIRAADGSERAGTAWNSTQVYRRTGDEWRVVHVHWSFTKHPAAIQGLMT